MTKGKTILIHKEFLKETAPNNYRPITCLPMVWKILTAQIREVIYYSLISCGLFSEIQKGCRKWTRGIEELLYTDQLILNESKTRWKNLAMAWMNYKKSYDMVPQNWIINMRKISDKVINFIEKTMETFRVQLTAVEKKFSWGKDPERYIPERCTITITICNSDDATQSHTREMHWRIQN